MNVARNAQKPIAWLGTGQNFIGNIERYRVELLKNWLMPGSGEKATVMQILDTAEYAS
jgi:hypothetical protein